MNDSLKSRLLVASQFALLLLLIVWPGDRSGWGFLDFLFEFIAVLMFIGGVAVLVLALRELFNHSLPKFEGTTMEKNLKALKVVFPEPMDEARLVTSGVFSFVRHPIYVGLLLIGYSIGIGSGPVPQLFFAIGLHAVLNYKANFEEQFLLKKFSGYAGYQAKTGRFFPKVED